MHALLHKNLKFKKKILFIEFPEIFKNNIFLKFMLVLTKNLMFKLVMNKNLKIITF